METSGNWIRMWISDWNRHWILYVFNWKAEMACDDIWWSAKEESEKKDKNEEEPKFNHESESELDGGLIVVIIFSFVCRFFTFCLKQSCHSFDFQL